MELITSIVPFLLGSAACKHDSDSVTPQNSTTLSVKKGATFYLTLLVQYSNGSTGFIWNLVNAGDDTARNMNNMNTVVNPQNSAVWGNQVWNYTALAKGTTTLEFHFARPTVLSEATDKKTYKITVTD
ncbi:putative secreted protein [Spirosoma lacussanchae]|uniref:protease inhibitor I42 family protein n=1 Tax=Spirosoma lacussanchae TaxID=1884249 RepID=UPI001109B182|nr:protease inhibitor I42 family protein [Spirosoma lacussanchae]